MTKQTRKPPARKPKEDPLPSKPAGDLAPGDWIVAGAGRVAELVEAKWGPVQIGQISRVQLRLHDPVSGRRRVLYWSTDAPVTIRPQ